MSFWEARDLIPVGQKKISIQAENGLEYSLGQKINFVIPASTGFMMPSETYLRMDVKVQCPSDSAGAMTRLQLDGDIGINVLIRDIRISSGGASNVLLEEIQNANVLTALRYDYNSNDNIKAKRALTEGTQYRAVDTRCTRGCTDTNMNNITSNSYYPKDETAVNVSQSTTFKNADYQTVKGLIKLPTGIFQNDKIFPLMMTDGLRIEIILEDAAKSVRCLETVLKDRRLTHNPLFHSLNGSNSGATGWAQNASASSIYLQRANGVVSVGTCPFVVGEKVSFFDFSSGTGLDYGADAEFTITAIEQVASATVGDGGTGADNGLVKLHFAERLNANAQTIAARADVALYSRSVLDAATYIPTATINNVELIVQQVTMPDGYTSKLMSSLQSGGVMNYDFLSFTNYKYSQQSSDRVVNIRLPLMNSRCKGVLCIPTDATVYTNKQALACDATYQINSIKSDSGDGGGGVQNSTRSGLVGIADHASEYQFVYDGQLNPNRKVPLSRQSANGVNQAINQQVFIEQEKALHVCGIDALSFEKWQENFFIGRAFTLGNGIYDSRGKDFNLQVEYLESTAPSKDKLWHCFCGHIRRIVVSGQGISLEI